MASSYNQRSGSSGSNAPRKTSVSKNSNNKAGLNRSKAGYYAQGSKKSAQGESFESRAARKRIAALPHTNDPLQMSSSNRTFTAKKGAAPRSTSTSSSGFSSSSRRPKAPVSQLSGSGRQGRGSGYSLPPAHAGGRAPHVSTHADSKRTAGASRTVGRSIGDIKASKPVPSFFDVNRHIIMRLGLICGIAAAVVVLFVVLYHLPILKIDNVTVSNNKYLSAQTVLDLAEVPDNATLLNPGTQGIQERVASNPWVESVHVRRVFPSGIDIVVSEAPITATVDVPVTVTVPTPTVWALSPDGVWLDRVVDVPEPTTVSNADGSQATTTLNADASTTAVTTHADGSQTTVTTAADGTVTTTVAGADGSTTTTAADGSVANTAADGTTTTTGPSSSANGSTSQASTAGTAAAKKTVSEEELRIAAAAKERPTIVDVTSSINPVAGEACTDAGILNAIAIISKSSEDFSSQIEQISAPSVEKTVLLLKNGVTVAFGSAGDITSKERVVKQLLAEHEGNISYINVRVTDRPAWRGLV